MSQIYETYVSLNERASDDMTSWPENARHSVNAAAERLLKEQHDKTIINSRSYFMDRSDPRFPSNVPSHVAGLGVLEVEIAAVAGA